MKKLLVITLEYPPQLGGIANYVSQYVKHYSAESVVVLAPVAKDADDSNSLWKVIRTKPFWPLVWPHWLRLFFTVRSIVKKEGITDLHIHHVLPAGYVAYFLKKWKSISSYTIFLHGTDVAMAVKQKRKLAWFQKICSGAEKLVVNSVFLERRVREFVDKTPISVVHPCPSPQFSEPVTPELLTSLRAHLALSGKKVLLTVGRMVDGKGFPHCIRLLPKIMEHIPNVVWLMVGNGPKRNDIISLVQKHSLQNAVRFLGDVKPDQLPPFYQLADAFVLLTHPDGGVEEGWGTVFLEAAASGLPVVAGQSGGVVEAVENGVAGYVVDVYQDEKVVQAIVSLLTDGSKGVAMGAAGKSRVAAEFTWENQLAKL